MTDLPPESQPDPDATILGDSERTVVAPNSPSPDAYACMTISRFIAQRGIENQVAVGQSSELKSSLDLDPDQRYDVTGTLAEGEQSTLLDARDLAIRRQVAMKFIRDQDASNEEAIARFIEEGQLTGQLEHPNIVPVHEVGINQAGQPFYTLKRIRGHSLAALLEKIRKGTDATLLPELLEIFTKACQAIAYAHDNGVIHRDLQPDKIMLGDFGEVMITDWGSARVLDHPDKDAGAIIGPPAYMAPEQAADGLGEPDARADVYALGGILYEILTLKPPIVADDETALLEAKIKGAITPPVLAVRRVAHTRTGYVPVGPSSVAMKALSLRPDDRYSSMSDFTGDIERWTNGFAPRAEKAGFFRQLQLIARRHRSKALLLLASSIIAVTLGVGFTIKTRAARNVAIIAAADAKAALAKQAIVNRTAAEQLHRQGRRAIVRLDWEKANQRLRATLDLAPDKEGIHHDLSRVLAANGDLEGAYEQVAGERTPWADLLRRTLKIKQEHDGYLWPRDLQAFRIELGQIGEGPVSSAVQGWITEEKETRKTRHEAAFAEFMRDNPNAIKPQIKFGSWLHLEGKDIHDLSALAHIQCNQLSLIDISDIDLLPLRHMPLIQIQLSNCAVTDLSAFKGMKIERLDIRDTPVKDITPILSEYLTTLSFNNIQVTDISGIRQCRSLTRLSIKNCKVDDISAAQGLSLKHVDLSGSLVTDLSPLRGAPIDTLVIWNTQITDLSAIIDAPITVLNLMNTPVTSLEPLRGMPLRDLEIKKIQVTDLSPLIGTPLEVLKIDQKQIDTLSLTELSIKHLRVGPSSIIDITRLKGLKIQSLDFYGVKKVVSPEILRTMPNLTSIFLFDVHKELPELVKVLLSMPQLQTINGKPAAEAREKLLKKLEKN